VPPSPIYIKLGICPIYASIELRRVIFSYFIHKDHLSPLKSWINEKQGKIDNSGEMIKYLSEKLKAYSFVFTNRWFDIGSKELLEEANKVYSNK